MNILNGSWQPKAIAFVGGAAQIVAQFYPSTQQICGMISALAFLALGMVTRQDNKSSEQVGAGNVPSPNTFYGSAKLLLGAALLLTLWGCGERREAQAPCPSCSSGGSVLIEQHQCYIDKNGNQICK